MSVYRPAESDARIQVRVADSVRRRGERRALRKQLAAARRAGLARRHQAKLTERKPSMVVTTDNAPAAAKKARRTTSPDAPSTEPVAGELEQMSFPEVDAAIPVVDFEEHFRLADTHLQNAVRHLRKLRHIPDARDALKLVRQAQNRLMDAEDS